MPVEKDEDSCARPNHWRQIFACVSVCMSAMTLGATSGFSGVIIPQLQNVTITGFAMTEDELSWYASLQVFAMVPTGVLGGLMGQHWGRKYSLMLICPLYSVGFMCQGFATDIALLFFGRILAGVAGGLSCGPCGTYVSEVPTPDLRTTMGGSISAFYNLGMVTIFTLGAFFHWRVLAFVTAAFPLIGLVLMAFVPESPGWFIVEGRYEEAQKALQWLRGPKANVKPELLNMINSLDSRVKRSRMTSISGYESISSLAEPRCGWISRTVKVFLRPDVYKPFGIVVVASFLQQFSGMSTISYYAVNVLAGSGSSIDEYLATIIYGLMRLVSQVLGSFLLIRFQRRHLLVFSCVFVSLAMSLLATSAYLNNRPGSEEGASSSGFLGVLPLIAVTMAAVMYHIGLGPIPWSYLAELFPLDVRSFMSGMGNSMSTLYIALVVKTFPAMVETMTMPGTYWFYSGVTLGTIVFTLLCLPETKGKDFAQISQGFSKAKAEAVAEDLDDDEDLSEHVV